MHTVVVVDGDGRPMRVDCGYCHSEHNYRGGPRIEPSGTTREAVARPPARPAAPGPAPFPIVSDRERTMPPRTAASGTSGDLELLLRRIIREEAGITPVAPAEKWRGGTPGPASGHSGLTGKELAD